ncbi:MAG: Gfo/Idh/MocA family oxidoreductase [Bacteroidales bacterium]|nr:Gfo/Idh/MocA family oxidoreductase [Bacteroidales bacterium]
MALRIGVIGAGHFGKYHLQALKNLPEVELMGFFDIDPMVQQTVSHDFKVKSYNSYDELLSDVDIVDIVTPTISHYECALEAIRHQKHVFIEKPVTHNVETAQHLIKMADEAGVKVQVGHIERFNPAFLAVEPYINKPMYIEAHRLQPFTQRSLDISVVLNLMIHDLDIILYTVKSNIKRISANGAVVATQSADVASARIEFENGCVAHITSSRISIDNMRTIKLFQKDNCITIDFLNKKAEIIWAKQHPTNQDHLEQSTPVELTSFYPPIILNNAILEEMRSFVNAIKNNTSPIVTLEHAYYAIKIAFEIMEKVKFSFES